MSLAIGTPVAVLVLRRVDMDAAIQTVRTRAVAIDLDLSGYRFSVCASPEEANRALDVRRRVYVGEKGYDVGVPDPYDDRSWLLLAEDARTGEAVGTLRITCAKAGAIEMASCFQLPARLSESDVAELSRLAILPSHRASATQSLAVSLGLFKMMVRVILAEGIRLLAVCSKAERIWSYTWLQFRSTGVSAPYTILDGAMHEILLLDLRHGPEPYQDTFDLYDFFFAGSSPEITIPDRMPPLGVHRVPTA
jgi:hypothetical protein